jgi:phospholipid/cholesterol/gamma-HCH transport system substrate-binding protein
MKISNETKIGALAAVSIALLILGFNFLKGKTCLNTTNGYSPFLTRLKDW